MIDANFLRIDKINSACKYYFMCLFYANAVKFCKQFFEFLFIQSFTSKLTFVGARDFV